MIIETLSTFPDMYESVMGTSIMKRAQDKGILSFHAYDLRDWTYDRHRTTDDDPYGGGAGLVMKCEPIFEAVADILGSHRTESEEYSTVVEPKGTSGSAHQASSGLSSSGELGGDTGCPDRASSARAETSGGRFVRAQDCLSESGHPVSPLPTTSSPRPKVIFLAPQGRPFTDAYANELARENHLLFVCGHYEGIDERAYGLADQVISLGDYVLTSGELASMVVIDAVVRKLPGVLGAQTGPLDESFADGLLEYPQYTRPACFHGMEVPEVLLSGNHGAISRWRREQSLRRTAELRPDLLQKASAAGHLSPADQKFLLSLNRDGEPRIEGVS